MQRITITVEDDLAEWARHEVEIGRAPSVSAWVARAMADKRQALLDLDAEITRMEAESPATPEDIAWLAKVFGESEAWVRDLIARELPLPRERPGPGQR